MPSFYDRRPAGRTASAELHQSMLTVRAGDLPLCEGCQEPLVKKATGAWVHATHGFATCRDGSGGRAKVPASWTPPVPTSRRG